MIPDCFRPYDSAVPEYNKRRIPTLKKQNRCRAIALSLLISIFLSSCGNSPEMQDAGTNQAQTLSSAPAAYTGTEFEKDFIRQHVEYIKKGDFSILTSDEGNMAASMAKNYEEWGLNTVHKTWESISKVSMAIGNNTFDLTNEYEVLLSQLILDSTSSESFQNTYHAEHYAAWQTLLTDLKAQFQSTEKMIKNIPTLNRDNIVKIATQIDDLLVLLQQMEGAKKGQTVRLFDEEVKKFKAEINEIVGKDNQKLINTLSSEAKFGAYYLDILADSFDDFMNQYILLQAYQSSSAEWMQGWKAIAEQLEGKTDRDTQKINKALDSILTQFEKSRSDPSAVLFHTAGTKAMEHAAETAYRSVFDALEQTLNKNPVIKGIRQGTKNGIDVSNFLVNVDDIAYYGQMLLGSGIVGKHAEQALEDSASRLLEEPTYENALLFDQLFHIYRSIQVSACRYAIQYYNAIADSTVSHTLKYISDDEIAEMWNFQTLQTEWETCDCHKSFYYSWLENEQSNDASVSADNGSETMELFELGRKEIRDMDYRIAQQPGWDKRQGVLSAVIRDFDGDGQEDLALLTVECEEEIQIERIITEVPLTGPGQKLCLSLYTIENGDVSWKDTMDIYSMNNLQDLNVRIFTFDKGTPASPDISLFLQANYYMLPSNYGTPTYAVYRYDGEHGKIRESLRLQQTTGGSMNQGYGMFIWNEETEAADIELIWQYDDSPDAKGTYGQRAANLKEAFEMALTDRGLPDPDMQKSGSEMETPDETWPDYYPSWYNVKGMEPVCSITGGGTTGRSDTGYEYWMNFYDSSKLRDMLETN